LNQLKSPPWLRTRTPAELDRERAHLEALKWYEKLAMAVGYKLRPKVRDEKAKDNP
jgi:hypothetical protein